MSQPKKKSECFIANRLNN